MHLVDDLFCYSANKPLSKHIKHVSWNVPCRRLPGESSVWSSSVLSSHECVLLYLTAVFAICCKHWHTTQLIVA